MLEPQSASMRPPIEEPLYEVVDGKSVELPPMGFYECGIASILGYYMEHFSRSNQLGRVRIETLFCLGLENDLERRPDVAFVSFKRWPKKRRLPRTNAGQIVPDLAVEVISETNLAKDVQIKINEYFRAGVGLVWVVFPDLNQIHVYESPTDVRILKQTEELDGGKVLPGFRLPVAALFEDELEAEDAT
jgi:Uma2 family endonuclease